MDNRVRRSRETSPDRTKQNTQHKLKPFRKVQVVYYLCRNGQLEHPHFMEISHLANQQLRLKDVMNRLSVLRGKGIPSLYSWSCKRSYRNGYVWNDLAENDVIYPSEGSEYILKGSALIEGSAEKFQQLQISNRQQNPESYFHPKGKLLVGHQHREPEEEKFIKEEEDDVEEEEKRTNSSSNNQYSRYSREVIEKHENLSKTQNNTTEFALEDTSPPLASSTISERDSGNNSNAHSQRFEDCELVSAPIVTRNSVLLQLITCGSSAACKGRNGSFIKQQPLNTNARKSSSFHKGLLCKTVRKMIEEEEEINYMSENPQFGNPEEKEFFSGSIFESMTEARVSADPVLKKSSSYNEERSSQNGLAEIMEEIKGEEKKVVKGKCIPRRDFPSSQVNK